MSPLFRGSGTLASPTLGEPSWEEVEAEKSWGRVGNGGSRLQLELFETPDEAAGKQPNIPNRAFKRAQISESATRSQVCIVFYNRVEYFYNSFNYLRWRWVRVRLISAEHLMQFEFHDCLTFKVVAVVTCC